MSKRWSFIFILLALCIIGTVADDWNQPYGDPNAGSFDQYSAAGWHHNNPSWNYPSWYDYNYNWFWDNWFWDYSWQPTWSYYSTPVWQYTAPVYTAPVYTTPIYTAPAYVNWNTCEICFPATTVTTKPYYSMSMTRYYSIGSTSLAFPIGLWW